MRSGLRRDEGGGRAHNLELFSHSPHWEVSSHSEQGVAPVGAYEGRTLVVVGFRDYYILHITYRT